MHTFARKPTPSAACSTALKPSPLLARPATSSKTCEAASPEIQFDFARVAVVPPLVQRKSALGVNEPGDEHEQEADRIADHVMRTPEPRLQRTCACGGECPECRKKQTGVEETLLQTKRLPTAPQERTDAPPIVHEVLASPGHPLDPETRELMESRFGHDFGAIRIHADPRAAESAGAVQARAYTVGAHVVFGAGQAAFHTAAGRSLLAHELTHTLQQGAAKPLSRGEDAGAPVTAKATAQILQRQSLSDERPCQRGEMRLGPGLPCFRLRLPGHDCPPGQLRLGPSFPCVPLRGEPEQPYQLRLGLPTAPSPSSAGCRFTVRYANEREVDCARIWRENRGQAPPGPLCGRALRYDIVSVSASGSGCPPTLEGLMLSETVTPDHGCTPPDFVFPPPSPCRIGPGGTLSGCTDTYSFCGLTSALRGSCTEVVTQNLLVDGQVAETHTITFALTKNGERCTGTARRS